MILMQGKSVSDGVAHGPVCFLRRPDLSVAQIIAGDPETEKVRFRSAREQAALQLCRLAEKCREWTAGEEKQKGGGEDKGAAAALFEAQAMLARDESFGAFVEERIEAGHCGVREAVNDAGEHFAAVFEAMDSAYMRARAEDIRDVARQIAEILAATAKAETENREEAGAASVVDEAENREEAGASADLSAQPAILAAAELSPAELIRLDRSRILGIALCGGSENSHTALLARSMGLPAVFRLGDALRQEYDGREAWIDGGAGQVVIGPDESMLAVLREKRREEQERRKLLEPVRGERDVTPDGRELTICCNISSPEEVSAVLENGGRGIGLFRTEFLCLSSGGYPSEEEQFEAYRTVVEGMKGRRTVLRTFDVGADKRLTQAAAPARPDGRQEEQTRRTGDAPGMRGIRVSLSCPDVFRTQLRAMYRASAYGEAAILFPMITSVWEIRACGRICAEVMDELEREGVPYDRQTELGIMIETPAAVLLADELAKEADFFSVGTNDLAQYMLACDRQTPGMERFFDPGHPAVLRGVEIAAKAARAAGIRISVCGELAARPEYLGTFLAAGIDGLSVPPPAVLPLRARLRSYRADGACSVDPGR